ncbi:MAG TPA: NAD(P)H-dependent oxidoreductase [Rhizobacter sp.]|nr:NAD(P)H-dependent oxidoreductase [Rhizobacter sp.]
MTDVLVLTAHPHLEHSRVNRALMQAAAAVDRVEVRDLYALYPDYLIDVAAEQDALLKAQLIVWQHPLHWYHMPPLMKLWVDEVLAFGWSYGPEGHALRGKDLWLITSTGGTEDSYRPDAYNRYHFDAFMPPYEQTATLCGMRFLPPMVLHGAHHVSEAELTRHAHTLAERLRRYPDWPELAALEDCVACEVPVTARPQDLPVESA